ncbi:MAG: lysyl oxidase family protein, partial [Nocardioides sp.]
MHRRHTRLAATLACATLAVGTSSISGGAAAAPAEGSPIALWAPDRVVTESWGGRVYTDFGLRVTAPTAPFELWSTRASYDEPIRTEWRAVDGTVLAELDPGTMSDFSGLPDFLEITVRRVSDGAVVRQRIRAGCFNGRSQRIEPEAPARSPYPQGCPWNPYTLGSVMGIQQGHAVSLGYEWARPMRLTAGRYDVTSTIAPSYVSMFGIDPADARRVTRLVVTDGRTDGRTAARPRLTTAETSTPAAGSPAAREPGAEAAGVIPETQPDLRSLPAFGALLNGKGTMLRFSATVWNGGDSPLVVDGFQGGGEDHLDAYQYFFDGAGNETGHQLVGEMQWHAENHQHWHFEDFAQYSLLNADKTEVVRSTKQSFCLANTDAVDYTRPNADWNPTNTSLESDCGEADAISVRQVLSAGSGDTYTQYRAGQAFPVKN